MDEPLPPVFWEEAQAPATPQEATAPVTPTDHTPAAPQSSPAPATVPSGQGGFQDITLYDVDTGEPFIFTAKEQAFYAKNGLTHVPQRSPERRRELEAKKYGKPLTRVRCISCGRTGKILIDPEPTSKMMYCEECFIREWNQYLSRHPELQSVHQPMVYTPPMPKSQDYPA